MSTYKPPRDCEELLQKTNSFITLKPKDRSETAANYNIVRDYIFKKMREADKAFNQMSRGTKLAGSYADNLKVTSPNEYDLVMKMKVPYRHLAKIEKDSNAPGYVKINIKDLLAECAKNPNNEDVHKRLEQLADKEGYLLQAKFQSWIESIWTKIQIHGHQHSEDGRTFVFQYSKTGPAHTCYVSTTPVDFSVDFVPGFVFDETTWPAEEHCPDSSISDWVAIPKPSKGVTKSDNILWQTSYVDSERSIIANQNNLKNTLRMLKKLRDRMGLTNFKSYFIKSLYLWECHEERNFFFKKSATSTLMHMLKKWCECLRNEELPFYWEPECNLLGNLTKSQISTMHGQLNKVYSLMEKYMKSDLEKIFTFFLTDEEMKIMKSDGNIADVIKPKERSWCVIS